MSFENLEKTNPSTLKMYCRDFRPPVVHRNTGETQKTLAEKLMNAAYARDMKQTAADKPVSEARAASPPARKRKVARSTSPSSRSGSDTQAAPAERFLMDRKAIALALKSKDLTKEELQKLLKNRPRLDGKPVSVAKSRKELESSLSEHPFPPTLAEINDQIESKKIRDDMMKLFDTLSMEGKRFMSESISRQVTPAP